jgi:hypothetical protein
MCEQKEKRCVTNCIHASVTHRLLQIYISAESFSPDSDWNLLAQFVQHRRKSREHLFSLTRLLIRQEVGKIDIRQYSQTGKLVGFSSCTIQSYSVRNCAFSFVSVPLYNSKSRRPTGHDWKPSLARLLGRPKIEKY